MSSTVFAVEDPRDTGGGAGALLFFMTVVLATETLLQLMLLGLLRMFAVVTTSWMSFWLCTDGFASRLVVGDEDCVVGMLSNASLSTDASW